MQKQRLEAMDIWFAYFNKEIGLHQLNRMLKDLGWTDDEIEEALENGDDETQSTSSAPSTR